MDEGTDQRLQPGDRESLRDKYSIVADRGPDVARLGIALTNVTKNKPVISAVTSVVPVGIAISLVKKGTAGSWTGSGATSAESKALDSMTNEVIAVAVDEQTARFTEDFPVWGQPRMPLNSGQRESGTSWTRAGSGKNNANVKKKGEANAALATASAHL